MKIAYLECATGISGDMTLAALLDAGIDEQALKDGILSLNLPGVELHIRDVMKSCFRAKSIQIVHGEQHAHRHLSDITRLIRDASGLSQRQKNLAQRIFEEIARAEASVHGTDLNHIHFHEVGAIDSIVDIVGAAIGFDLLGADQIVCGPIPTGRGQVRIDHGLCAVPTPGTAELLRGIPLRDVPIDAELTTPTGAAIVRVLANRFGPLPEMSISAIGCGAGTKDFPDRANILRLFVGEATGIAGTDEVSLLETNLDDVTGEVIGYTRQQLLAAGALDVWSTSIQMKKDRPGVLLSVLCRPGDVLELESILFRETGTLGIRRQQLQRTIRQRQSHTVLTEWGAIPGKVTWNETGQAEFSAEYEDCVRIATESQRPLREVQEAALRAFEKGQPPAPMPLNLLPQQGDALSVDRDVRHDHSHDHTHDHDHGHDHGHGEA